jgi:hypothetical protein
MAQAVAMFAAESDGDLTLRLGQWVVLTRAPEHKQWWKGYLQNDPVGTPWGSALP